ncbi:isochorismatase family protein [Stieleria sp. JC731]|nr:ThuA domain-containing protein [Stieleria sp. JC731]MCC9603242.1 isochorismatase family protein [Stieleria sp. JC731]
MDHRYRSIVIAFVLTYASCLCMCSRLKAAEPMGIAVELRSQDRHSSDSPYLPKIDKQTWKAQETAIIVCDMWDSHHCYRAVQRATEMAPRMNRLMNVLRDQGVTVIHAPSGCMDAYQNHPSRQRSISEPKVDELPDDITKWCYSIAEEAAQQYPIDQTDGGEDDTEGEHEAWRNTLLMQGRNPDAPWTKQMDLLQIDPQSDWISDRGDEIWSILENRSIKNVMLVGVHTNMCVLGRPFGLRQLAKNGMNVVLVRDLTDTMYNPAAKPYVSHFTGTDLIVSYIERTVCPTISSDQILGGSPHRFRNDDRPTIAMMIGESEYNTAVSLPAYALENLGKQYRVVYVLESLDAADGFVGLEQLEQAELLIVSVRRKLLPIKQLELVRQFIELGKPVIGIRTASHAFCLRNPESAKQESKAEFAQWPEFDSQVFGGHYTNHHGNNLASLVSFVGEPGQEKGQSTNPMTSSLLQGVDRQPFQQGGSLYKVRPLADGTQVLAVGRANGVEEEPVAWTYQRSDGGWSFYTSLGHEKDFLSAPFVQMLTNVINQRCEPRIPASH